ncbi:MAG: hypothetical protein K0R99_2745 [Microbacterium sp.]|nr:hypothetical protein [Microbacterium sp.]
MRIACFTNRRVAMDRCSRRRAEQDPRHRRCVAHVEVGEAHLVEVQRVEHGRVGGSAGPVRDDERLREGLERADDLQHEVEEDDRCEQRQGDPEELPHAAGSVDGCRLVVHRRDLTQSGEEDDHRRAERPDAQDDERVERGVRRRHPALALDAQQGEDLVHQTLDAEDLTPQYGDGHRPAQERREVEDRAVEGESAKSPVQDHREQQRRDQLQRHRDEHEAERDAERVVKSCVVEHPREVVEPDPLRRLQQVVVGERQVQRHQHRPDGERHHAYHPGQQEQVGRTPLAALGLARLVGAPHLRLADVDELGHGAHTRTASRDSTDGLS